MDIRSIAIPVVTSLVVGIAVYALSLSGQQSLRAELEQLRTMRGDVDKRFAEVDALVSRLESIDIRVSSVEKTLTPSAESEEAATPAPAAAASDVPPAAAASDVPPAAAASDVPPAAASDVPPAATAPVPNPSLPVAATAPAAPAPTR